MRLTPALLVIVAGLILGFVPARAVSASLRGTVAQGVDAGDEVTVGPPTGIITNAEPVVSVPVRVSRSNPIPAVMAFHVRVAISPPLFLPNGRFDIALGGFLNADGGRTAILQTSDLGGGVYDVTGTIVGQPCGSSALSGALFSLAVSSEAESGTGSVTIESAVLRDCTNQDVYAGIGPPAAVMVDRPVSTVTVGPPSGLITLADPAVVVPVRIQRTGPTQAVMAFSVRVTLSPSLFLPSGPTSITMGDFLNADGGRTISFQTTSLGGGIYVVEGTTVGQPCGSTALEGTLCNLTVSSTAEGGSGTVAIDEATLRDCLDQDVSRTIVSPAQVYVDQSAPNVTLTSPNGGETWFVGAPVTITWSGNDPEAVADYSLSYSTDGGWQWSPIAAGVGGSSYAWTVPDMPSSTFGLRVTAQDTNGNVGVDDNDDDFAVRYITVVPTAGPHGAITPPTAVYLTYLGTQTFTFNPDPGYRIFDVIVDGVSQGAFGTHTFADVTTDHTIDVTFAELPPAPQVTGLAATQVRAGNPAGSTTSIRLTWDPPPPGTTVEVWRAGFGNYPEYDDTGGAEPSAPGVYPPAAAWVLTGVTASGGLDLVGERDCYYYVAYARDSLGAWSAVSTVAGGVPNYHLGDVSTGYQVDAGDNLVGTEDLSLLGAHYGLQGDSVAIFAGLDVGPTTTLLPAGRPVTDDLIGFEDLVIFALNFEDVSKATLTADGAGPATDEIRLDAPAHVPVGADVAVRLVLRGSGAVRALSAQLGWDPAVVAPTGTLAGEWLTRRGGVAFAPRAGAADVAVLQPGGMAGEGAVATVTFRVLAAGAPRFRIASIVGRDDRNQDVGVELTMPSDSAPAYWLEAAPNPFVSAVTIRFQMVVGAPANLQVFAADGRRVCTLAAAVAGPGEQVVTWDGRDAGGGALPAGVYYARVTGARDQGTQRLVFIK